MTIVTLHPTQEWQDFFLVMLTSLLISLTFRSFAGLELGMSFNAVEQLLSMPLLWLCWQLHFP